MSVIWIIIILALAGFLLWLIETYVPMNPTIKRIIEIVVILVIVLWLLQVFGVLGAVNEVRVQPIR